MYHVSSLEQRSAGHSLVNYHDKHILKFGGSKIYYNLTKESQYNPNRPI